MKTNQPVQPNEPHAILPSSMGYEPTNSDLEILVRKCRAGDSASWGQLVERLQALVWSSITRVGLKNEDAEDTFQRVFVILYRSLDRIESAQALPKWIATTAAREAIRLFKQNQEKATLALDEYENLDQVLASEEASIEEVTVAVMQSNYIRSVIRSLPGKCPQLLTMLYSEQDNTYDEVKTKLGIPSGSIGPTRARCIERLRQALLAANFFENESKTNNPSS